MSGRIRARLDAIQARAEAATPGPWEVQEPGGWATISSGPDSVFHAYSEEIACACGDPVDGPPQVAIGIEDAEFIAAARTDLPALLAFAQDVLALHRPERPTGNLVTDATPSYCGGCYEAGGYDGAPFWEDCPVVALATRHLGGEA